MKTLLMRCIAVATPGSKRKFEVSHAITDLGDDPGGHVAAAMRHELAERLEESVLVAVDDRGRMRASLRVFSGSPSTSSPWGDELVSIEIEYPRDRPLPAGCLRRIAALAADAVPVEVLQP